MENNINISNEIIIFFFICVITAWITSQTFKAILNCAIAKNFKLNYFFKCLFADGDFPSSHTCLSVTSLIVMFPVAEQIIASEDSRLTDLLICRLIELLWVLFVFVVVKDAISVRGSLKKISCIVKNFLSQPELFLNEVTDELQSVFTEIAAGININVGHLPHEVIGGLILAIIIGVGANCIRTNNVAVLTIDIIISVLYFLITFFILTNKKTFFKQYKKLLSIFIKKDKK